MYLIRPVRDLAARLGRATSVVRSLPFGDIVFPPARGPVYLGLDRNRYPGPNAMAALREAGFRFTSYWLNDPRNDTIQPEHRWGGKRELLVEAGFGFLVLYWGRQVEEILNPLRTADGRSAPPRSIGVRDAEAAVRRAIEEGFARRTILFLDVEAGGTLPPEYLAYVSAWALQVRKRGFAPGVYCSACATAAQLHKNPETAEMLFWVYEERRCPSPGCVVPDPLPHPAMSGVPFAAVWQYARSPRGEEVGTAKAEGRHGYTAVPVPDRNGVPVEVDYCYARRGGAPDGEILTDDWGERLFVDLNVATWPDPSGGREEPAPFVEPVLAIIRPAAAVVGILREVADFREGARVIADVFKAQPSVLARVQKLRDSLVPAAEYRAPTSAQACTMAIAFSLLVAGDVARAGELVRAFGYRAYRASSDGRRYFVLDPGSGPYREWGLYLFAMDEESNTLVEIPHPKDDEETELMGVEAFTAGKARALFVAGARRGEKGSPSDVADAGVSVFQAIHERAVDYLRCRTGTPPKVLQLHGFTQAGGRHPNCPAVFVSAGSLDPAWQEVPTSVVEVLTPLMSAREFTVGRYDTPGRCDAADPDERNRDDRGLAATENEQGKYCRVLVKGTPRAWFVHVETVTKLRNDPGARAELATRAAWALDGRKV